MRAASDWLHACRFPHRRDQSATTTQSNLIERHDYRRCSVDLNGNPVLEEEDRIKQIFDQNSSLLVGGVLPHDAEVHVGEQLNYRVELLSQLIALGEFPRLFGHLVTKALDLAGEAPIL